VTLKFAKYEGLGNDFIVVDVARELDADPTSAQKLCDRHFGIGGDGVLSIAPPTSRTARARMVIHNADGSRPEMCGNGIRCVALHLARLDDAVEARYGIETDAGLLMCDVRREGDAAEVTVAMGRAEQRGEHLAVLGGQELRFTRISMGNPHAILFDAQYDSAQIDRFGPQVSQAFSEGSNVEFVRPSSGGGFDLVVWERGVGRTLACGTGAAATAVAAALAGRAPFDLPIEVRLPGGPLQITVNLGTLAVSMRGPARLVFSGESSHP
jgi:diaminopimelate epimerase